MDNFKLWEEASIALQRLFDSVGNKESSEVVLRGSRRVAWALRQSYLQAFREASNFSFGEPDKVPEIQVNGLVFRIEAINE